MYANTMLGLVAQTSIHAGASASEAAIDLPIQREGHTDWPVIFGSGMKGALRSHFSPLLDNSYTISIFGPDTTQAADHAGALLVSDARLLLLPVRSMTSHVKWVTCPALLKRMHKDMQRMGKPVTQLPKFNDAQKNTALVAQEQASLYLEEFRFTTKTIDLDSLISLLAELTGEELTAELHQNLVIVSDDQFRHLCRNAIPIQAHIAIDSTTKTVNNGALWYEENLPAETVMYCCLSCTSSRNESKQTASELMSTLQQSFEQHQFIQVGGNLTSGSGWFEVNWNGVTS